MNLAALLAVQVAVGAQAGGAFAAADSALTHNDGTTPSVVTAVRAERAPELDGYLDDQAWLKAPAVSGFRRAT